MDYANRRRVKVWGTARFVTDDPETGDPALIERLHDASYRAKPERALLFTVEAFDVNCPQHIHPRVLASDAAARIAELEGQVRELTARLAAHGSPQGSGTGVDPGRPAAPDRTRDVDRADSVSRRARTDG